MRVSEKEKKDCTGCGLCSKLCPVSAIKMVQDEEGFAYPYINDKCIDCSICYNQCPMNSNLIEFNNSHYYVGRVKDDDSLKKSASGGMFAVLSDEIIRRNGVVYGAVYDKDYVVTHRGANNYVKRDEMRDSKYVQSTILDCYDQLKFDLEQRIPVLFSGTPCQCAAIKKFISYKKVSDDNLYFVDIICHGVGSPLVWKKYLNYIANKYEIGTILSVVTRNKGYGTGYNMTISGDSRYHKKGNQDPYICLFGKNLILRPSCFNCPYKSMKRIGDVTIGDFSGKEITPQFNDDKGVSTVMFNSRKGNDLKESITDKIIIYKVDRSFIRQVNLHSQTPVPLWRNFFFKMINNNKFMLALKLFTEEGALNMIIGETKRIIKRLIY